MLQKSATWVSGEILNTSETTRAIDNTLRLLLEDWQSNRPDRRRNLKSCNEPTMDCAMDPPETIGEYTDAIRWQTSARPNPSMAMWWQQTNK
jgi:hypothetical protein